MKRYVSTLIVLLFALFLAAIGFTGRNEAHAQARQEAEPVSAQQGDAGAAAGPTLNCQGCHAEGTTLPYLAGALFHTEAHSAYDQGYHSQAVQGGRKAAGCLDCHATNGDARTILPASDPGSTIHRANIARTCGSCHGDPSRMAGTGISACPFLTYTESVHAGAIGRGNLSAAVCTDCHKSHDVLPASDSRSPIFRFNIAQTCGRCHPGASQNFVSGKVHMNLPESQDAGSVVVGWGRRIYPGRIWVVIGGMAAHNLLVWGRKTAARLRHEERPIGGLWA